MYECPYLSHASYATFKPKYRGSMLAQTPHFNIVMGLNLHMPRLLCNSYDVTTTMCHFHGDKSFIPLLSMGYHIYIPLGNLISTSASTRGINMISHA